MNLVAAFDLDVERVLIIANSSQGGQVGMNEEGGDPFDDPEAISGGNCGGNIAVGNTVAFGAKTDEGWKFICWMNEETEELYSMDETIYVTAEKPLTLKAVFDMDVERVLLNVKTEGRGQVALNEDGGDPVFEEGFHNDNVVTRVIPGDSVVVGAKADDDCKLLAGKMQQQVRSFPQKKHSLFSLKRIWRSLPYSSLPTAKAVMAAIPAAITPLQTTIIQLPQTTILLPQTEQAHLLPAIQPPQRLLQR